MSIELPEAYILAQQMSKELLGKEIANLNLKNHEKLQKLGFINRDLAVFKRLRAGVVVSIVSRGNVIRMKLDNGMNLILAPEYGGTVRYLAENNNLPEKFHLDVMFTDNSRLSVTLAGMGVIQVLRDEELEQSYVYRRDFSATVSPIDDVAFSFERFSGALAGKNVNIKTVLVGKEAVLVGLSNSAFQDILYRARIDPKRKSSDLDEREKQSLFRAIDFVVQHRIKSGGKSQFTDLYGKQGTYVAAMGPNMKGKTCIECGAPVEKLSLGGGQTYYCPECQK